MISYLPPLVAVDKNGLHNGGLNNPDGHGWAVIVDNGRRIEVGKSLNLDEALDGFIACREMHPEGAALFHSRWATHGSIKTANCHPFRVAGTTQTVVAHNGVITRKEATPAKGDDRSDSQKFADEVLLRQFKRLDRRSCIRALEHWIGAGNKLVILTVDPRFQCQAYLVNEHAGKWDTQTGIWHSNNDYRWVVARGYGYGYWDYEHWPTKIGKQPKRAKPTATEKCELCRTADYNTAGYCTFCHSCRDCGAHRTDCQCWRGDTHDLEVLREWEAGNDLATMIDLTAERQRRSADNIQLAAE